MLELLVAFWLALQSGRQKFLETQTAPNRSLRSTLGALEPPCARYIPCRARGAAWR